MFSGFLETVWKAGLIQVSTISEQITNLQFAKLQTKQNWEVEEVLIPASLLKFDKTVSYWGSASVYCRPNWFFRTTPRTFSQGPQLFTTARPARWITRAVLSSHRRIARPEKRSFSFSYHFYIKCSSPCFEQWTYMSFRSRRRCACV